MGATKISWADRVWNPVTGCTPRSEGCLHCYAQRMALRLRGRFGYPAESPFQPTMRWDRVRQPLNWPKARIFVCSMGDLFHVAVPDTLHREVWDTMRLCSRHTFLVLTKRPERMRDWLKRWGEVLPNLWVGVSCEDQQASDERIPLLLQCPAAVRFVSAEPLLGPIDLRQKWVRDFDGTRYADVFDYRATNLECGIDWVIAGGESGPGARPCDLGWLRSIRDQCAAAGVAFYCKQLGFYCIGSYHERMAMVGETSIGPPGLVRWRLRDPKGGDPAEWPEDLRVRQHPAPAAAEVMRRAAEELSLG